MLCINNSQVMIQLGNKIQLMYILVAQKIIIIKKESNQFLIHTQNKKMISNPLPLFDDEIYRPPRENLKTDVRDISLRSSNLPIVDAPYVFSSAFARIVAQQKPPLMQNNLDVERALMALEIDCVEVLERDRKKISETLGNLVIFDNIGVVVAEEPCMPPRYSEFYEYPQLNFCLRYTCSRGGKYSVRISANPLNNTGVSIIDIVRELELKSFGGHPGIVGGVIKESEEPEFTRKICEALNGKVRGGSGGSNRTNGDGEDSGLSDGGDE